MAPTRPELLFVAGPRDGRKVVLTDNVAMIGRMASCAVHVAEPHASREHARMVLTVDGWQVEVLSQRGLVISGRKYKRGKTVLLETGDVLTIGTESELLFVEAGDDPAEALAAYRSAEAPVAETPAPAPRAGPAAPPAEPIAPPPLPARPEAPLPDEIQEEFSPEEQAERARLAKRKKYLVVFGVYAAVMLVVIGGIFIYRSGDEDKTPLAGLKRLDDDEIARTIAAKYEYREIAHNQAARELQKALGRYADRANRGKLYLAVRSFKLHLAYANREGFVNVEDGRKFEEAKRELAKKVSTLYGEAYQYAKAGNASQAEALYLRLLEHLPETDPSDPVYTVILANVRERLAHLHKTRTRGKR